MAKSKIRYRKLSKYKYQLGDPYTCQLAIEPDDEVDIEYLALSSDGQLTIKKNYAWDGPSGPTFDTKTFMRGSLVHDALYQLIRVKHLKLDQRDYADRLLQKMCKDDGMISFRAWYVYHALKLFGKHAVKPRKDKKNEYISAPE